MADAAADTRTDPQELVTEVPDATEVEDETGTGEVQVTAGVSGAGVRVHQRRTGAEAVLAPRAGEGPVHVETDMCRTQSVEDVPSRGELQPGKVR